ncbi:ATP-binding protein [Thermoflavimicrobium daqui]|uniref:DUF87 domain-containing protein n=1 Tax=Thermoflavimicrobium daqui TaxID=2137476 RepID=A0A364K1N2_9BACL|nr:ATP-binding protein [Thermoflavimicrobium daqui]RAL21927.1 hypothetical protein DL897_15155 [Thermoflavimicrobium daqui]
MNHYNCPIVYFEDNIIFNSAGEFRAVYEIPPIHFDFLSYEQQMYQSDLWEGLLISLDDEECQLLMIPEIRRFDYQFDKLKSQIPEQLKETGNGFFDRTYQYLKQSKEMIEYHFFLSIKLVSSSFNVKKLSLFDRIKYHLKDTKRQLKSLGDDTFYILDEEMNEYKKAEQRLYDKVKYFLNGYRVPTDTIQWLLKRTVWRGIEEPLLRKNWTPRYEEVITEKGKAKKPTGDILTLFGGLQSDRYQRMLELEQFYQGEFRKSYLSFLSLTYLPDEREFPGFPWIYWIQEELDFPVEVSIRLKPIKHDIALKKVRNKQAELDEQAEHIAQIGGTISRNVEEAINDARELERDLSKDKFPILNTTVMFCVYAESEDLLHSYIDKLIYIYETKQFEIDIPRTDQYHAFSEFLIGSQQYIDQYQHPLDPNYVACSMFGATRDIGDIDGFYIGASGNQQVFVNPRRAPSDSFISTSPSIAVVGASGKGKTVGVNYLILNELMLGAQVLIIDPKGDRILWPDLMPEEIRNVMQVVSLGEQEQDKGKLDPLVGDPKGGASTAKRILKLLAAVRDGKFEATAIEEAVEQSIQGDNPCMIDVVERLDERFKGMSREKVTNSRYDDFETMVYTLKHRANSGQSMLLFGDGSQESINLNKQLTILQIQDLPNIINDKENEVLGLSLLSSLADFSRRFANQPSKHFKISVFDEAWRLAKTTEGRAVLEELIRTGRSQNSALYVVTQNARDLSFGDLDKDGDRGEEIRGNLGMRFCFHAKDGNDANSSCHLLGIEPTDENKRRLKSLRPGQCLMADLEGRVGEVEFIIEDIHPELFAILDTRPDHFSAQQEKVKKQVG